MFEFIAVSWFLTLGWVPLQEDYVGSRRDIIDENRIATVAEIGLTATMFERLTLSGSIENYQYVGEDSSAGYFNPYRVDYKASANIRITDHVSISAAHECDHAILTRTREEGRPRYQSGETIVSVTFKGGAE
jgi:hypothetical protein